jgi:hypothetical protein
MYNGSNLLSLRVEQPTEGDGEGIKKEICYNSHTLSFSQLMPRIVRFTFSVIVSVKIALSARPTVNVCRNISIALIPSWGGCNIHFKVSSTPPFIHQIQPDRD